MRLTPSQVAVRLICGHQLRMGLRDRTKEQLIREGHRMLVQMCRCDHGFDLIAWHNKLCETKAGGYRWGKRKGLPKNIENALADPAWNVTVEKIKRTDAERRGTHEAK
jgi:hypothetical protein